MPFRYCWLLLLLLGAAPASHAQTPTDTVARQLDANLRQLLVSPTFRVVQVRTEMVQDLQHNRVARLPGLLDYLQHRIMLADSIGRITKNERALVLAAAGQFRPLLAQVAADPPYYGRSCLVPWPTPPTDGLQQAAQTYVAAHLDSLVQAARQAHLPTADSIFLTLYLPILANPHETISDSLNAGLRRFVRRYPNSALVPTVKGSIRYEIIPSSITLGLNFSLGATFLQGGLADAFTNSVRLGLGGEASWKRYVLYLRASTSNLKPRTTYTFGNAVWLDDQGLNMAQYELLVGYCVLETKWFRVLPFAGASLLEIASYKVNNQIKPEADHRLWFGHPLTAGLNMELNFSNERRFGPGKLGTEGWFVQVRNGWRQAQALAGPPTAGSIYFFEVGVGGFARNAGTRR
ncbi:hypothetical protein [Hymenobacter negativus]|uniref:Uncharacterized protein n=1 Tax=Hymenobacter negativus TaxID=2795026 RepID=A0ABS3QAK3_9BACT|nr:hypothetical protein [Hymenobacter negativus]MBO2008182.1 hypothetical protein [Hymenobacter negativus]